MPHYIVSWTEKIFYEAYIEADSKQEALEAMYDGRCEGHVVDGVFIDDEYVEEE